MGAKPMPPQLLRPIWLGTHFRHPFAKSVYLAGPTCKRVPFIPQLNGIVLGNAAPDIDCAAHSVHHAGELDEHSVPCGPHDPAAMLGDLGVNQGAPVGLELGERAFFVSTHQPAAISLLKNLESGAFSAFFPG